jgi:hypothetical protein
MTHEEPAEMSSRRPALAFLALLAVILTAGLFSGAARAAPATVEIIAMVHPPAVTALQPLRDWLTRQGGKVRVTEIDAESPAGEQRLRAVGLSGHVPVLILIDGRYRFPRPGGGSVSLVKFPNAAGSPPGMRGDWVIADVQALVRERPR